MSSTPVDEKKTPESTVKTLPPTGSPSSFKARKSKETRPSTADSAHTLNGKKDTEVDLENAAAGAVEDEDLKEAEKEVEPLGWDADPENPRNFSIGKKWAMVSIISMYSFVTPLASSMMAPSLPAVAVGYGIDNPTIIALTLSIYLLSFALGPLFVAPLSEMYGRTWVLHVSNLVFVAFTIACAVAPTTASLIVFRFFAGLAGSAPLCIGAGSIADLFAEDGRAAALGIYTLGPLIGPVVGPVAGGFITEGLSYHWVFWVIAILGGVAAGIGIPLLKETYAPVIIARRAKKRGDVPKGGPLGPQKTLTELLWENMTRPVILLARSFICFILSLYMSIIYGIMYLMFVTFPTVYGETYGWNAGIAGLAYLGPGIGFITSTVICARAIDKIYRYLKEKNGGEGKPEYRIPMMFIGSAILPIGLFWYGWSADKGIHWIMPLIGSGIFGFAMMMCFLPIQVYLVDAFHFAASATAAAAVLRSLFGFAFPLFADRMFDVLGVGGGYSLVAGISIAVGIPFPVYIYFRGEQLRARSKYTR